jgi:hypothetical protein
MTITIDLAPELEQQIRVAAAQVGLAPAAYITETLRQQLRQTGSSGSSAPRVSSREAELLLAIHESMSAIVWERYHALIAKRHAETLTSEELQDLIALTNAIEHANVVRLTAVAELAQLRNTTLDALLDELGLTPARHA